MYQDRPYAHSRVMSMPLVSGLQGPANPQYEKAWTYALTYPPYYGTCSAN